MDWKTIIRSYSIYSAAHKEIEFNWFRQQPSIESVIRIAAEAKNERGKRFSHQSRITKKAIQEATTVLLDNADELKNVGSFHSLWFAIRNLLKPISGIGDLYIYDTALRIGAFLNFYPEKVYLHAGTRIGAKRAKIMSLSEEWIEPSELPEILQAIPIHEIEDILCIYKDKFI